MRDTIKSVIEFLPIFLLLTGIGAFIQISSIALKIDSTFTSTLLYSIAFLLLGIWLFRLMKRHQLKISILLIAFAILLILSSIIPDQTPTLLHTFGFPFPFVTIYSEISSGFI
ncbi:hypothetical protein ACTWP4_17380 [Gracilibacillus sp. D59]|uniref:hypothetical protein n=1 Tax=Gracilibacillus sp. D59 TaxID=3457434 RepID=UPI003FCCA8FA